MRNQQYSHIKRIVGDYVVSYGVIQSINDSCDIIDFFKINDSKYGVYLADVAGIGDHSETINKLQQIINKNCFECLEHQEGCVLDPALVVKNINTEMYTGQLGKYVTLIYGVLDLEINVLNYAVAGYYPNPILVDQALNAKYLFSKGYPLGIMPTANFENFKVELKENNSLILFSDGIMRFFKPDSGNKNKDDELLQLICSSNVEISNILEKLDLSYSTPVVDDIVILTIQRSKSK